MNKNDFLTALRNRLSGIPKEDIERSVDYYSEIIDDRIEEGLSEEEAVRAVGSINEIAAQILMETPLPKLVKEKIKPSRALRVWEIILLVLGSPIWVPLLATAMVLILTVYIIIWSVIVVLYSVDITFAACAIAGIFSSFAFIIKGYIAMGAMFFGFGLVSAGLAIFMFLGCNQISIGLLRLSKKLLLGIKSCFIRKEAVK